jgi:hypothetical protein
LGDFDVFGDFDWAFWICGRQGAAQGLLSSLPFWPLTCNCNPTKSSSSRSCWSGEIWLAGKYQTSTKRAVQCCNLVLATKETAACE